MLILAFVGKDRPVREAMKPVTRHVGSAAFDPLRRTLPKRKDTGDAAGGVETGLNIENPFKGAA